MAASSHPPPARVAVLLAKRAPIAVLIIRKRTKLFHIVRWKYATERKELEQGSRFTGKIYTDRCDVSFDGRHMVYFALGPSEGVFSWTAVCAPPALKALLFWAQKDVWSGGGVFVSEDRLWLDIGDGADATLENRSPLAPRQQLFTIGRCSPRGESHGRLVG